MRVCLCVDDHTYIQLKTSPEETRTSIAIAQKNLCAPSVAKSNTNINYLPQGQYAKLATVKDSKTDVSSVSRSSIYHDDGPKRLETSVFESLYGD